MSSMTPTRRQWRLLGGLAAYLLVLWLLWPTAVVYPLKIFVVFLHELSHAMAALATGGRVEAITLDPHQGGLTQVRGGNAFIMLSAGYLGSLLWGVFLVALAHARPRESRWALFALGILVLLVTIAFVRNLFGFAFGVAFGAALCLVSRRLRADAATVILTALGLTSALYAILDIRSDILSRPGAPSDAAMLAQLTGIPTLFWGFLWSTIAVATCAWLLHRLWRGR